MTRGGRTEHRRIPARFCGNGPNLWLGMQQAYDLWHAERALRKEIVKIPTVKAA